MNSTLPSPPAVPATFSRARWLAVGAAATVLVLAGIGHRVLLGQIDAALARVARLQAPLDAVPLELAGWRGRDVPLDERVRLAAHFDDEYVNRVYEREAGGAAVGVFVGYVGRPRARAGHRPDVCYAAHGWEQVAEVREVVHTAAGRAVPALQYEFRQPGGTARLLTLATYMINGRYVANPEEFQRYNTRGANLLGERPAYVARLQVSLHESGDRDADLALLRDLVAQLAEPTAALLPYWDGGASEKQP